MTTKQLQGYLGLAVAVLTATDKIYPVKLEEEAITLLSQLANNPAILAVVVEMLNKGKQ